MVRTSLVVLPWVLGEALVLESIQERGQRPAFDAGEAVQPEDFGDRVAVAFSVAEHHEDWLRMGCAGQFLIEVDVSRRQIPSRPR